HPAPHAHHAPYADLTSRPIKALSNEQIAAIRAGRGMGLALAAELNGYPGPLHVLELAQPLNLTATQKQKTEQLFNEMLSEAKQRGEQLISREAELDRLFRDKKATAADIATHTEAAALAQGRLRAAHLHYHLKMMEVLTPAQIEKYQQLRGYAKAE